MAFVLANRVIVGTATTGTGTITLGAAESGSQTFAQGGIADADTCRYLITEGSNFEIGTGTYTASGTTLARSVEESSNADAPISLAGAAIVEIVAAEADIVQPAKIQTLTNKTLGATTISGTFSFADNLVDRPYFRDVAETVFAVGSSGGGTQDFSLANGNIQSVTVDTSANTFTFSNPPATGRAGTLTLIITNGGSQTVNWPASVDWPGGTAPTLTAAGVDMLTFLTTDGGTTWYGFISGLAFA